MTYLRARFCITHKPRKEGKPNPSRSHGPLYLSMHGTVKNTLRLFASALKVKSNTQSIFRQKAPT